MIGGSAKSDRRADRRKSRVDDVEQGGIFDGEQARQPGILDIVDDQTRLQASNFGVLDEARGRQAELAWLRTILGVIDYDVLAPQERQGDVQRAGLGARRSRRGDDHVIARRQAPARKLAQGLDVVGLDDDLDVQLGAGIGDSVERANQSVNNRSFPTERNDDRIDRQTLEAERRRRRLETTRHYRNGPQSDRGEKAGPKTHRARRGQPRRLQAPERDRGEHKQTANSDLAPAQRPMSRQGPVPLLERKGARLRDAARRRRPYAGPEAPRRSDGDPDREAARPCSVEK